MTIEWRSNNPNHKMVIPLTQYEIDTVRDYKGVGGDLIEKIITLVGDAPRKLKVGDVVRFLQQDPHMHAVRDHLYKVEGINGADDEIIVTRLVSNSRGKAGERIIDRVSYYKDALETGQAMFEDSDDDDDDDE